MSAFVRKIINTVKAPQAIGPYSQAVLVDRTLYVSGQIGMSAESGKLVPGGTAAETAQALKNIGYILDAAGGSYKEVVKCTVLMANMEDFTTINNIYKQYFTEDYPARAAYQVAALPVGAKVEIEAVAILDGPKSAL